MNNIYLLLLLVWCICSNSSLAQNQEELVRDTYRNYKTAILNDKGAKAYGFINAKTAAYYDDLATIVREADSLEIESSSIADKFQILLIRNLASTEEIKAFTGKSLFIFSINNGLVGKNSTSTHKIGEVIVDKSFAKGEVVVRGQASNFYFHFYKEQNQWKLDLTSLFPVTNLTLSKMQKDSGYTENEFVLMLLEAVAKKKAKPSMWYPVISK